MYLYHGLILGFCGRKEWPRWAKPGHTAGESGFRPIPEFPSLAALRSGLTTDDADQRGHAYGAVLGADGDVQPSDVLDNDPSTEAVESLVEADVIPRDELGAGGNDRLSAAEYRERQVELLEEILDELSDDVVAQDGDAA